jgi:hypothetical protein
MGVFAISVRLLIAKTHSANAGLRKMRKRPADDHYKKRRIRNLIPLRLCCPKEDFSFSVRYHLQNYVNNQALAPITPLPIMPIALISLVAQFSFAQPWR